MGATETNKFGIVWASSYRRDTWPSRKHAAEGFARNPFYKTWNKRVFDLWIKYGLRDLPTALYPEDIETGSKAVTLTTTKAQETWTFLRPNYEGYGINGKPINRFSHADVDSSAALNTPFYRSESKTMYHQLPHLRPPTFFLMGEKSNMSLKHELDHRLGKTGTGVGGSGGSTEGNVDLVTLKGAGHLVPFERPQEVAEHTSKWLGKTLRFWFEEDIDFQESWSNTSEKVKRDLDQDWYKHSTLR